jgi:hypothetical protein
MAEVRFAWSPQLVDVRRQACPRARWNAQQRAWTMTDADGEAFLAAGHAQLTYTRTNFEIAIDGERWVIGSSKAHLFAARIRLRGDDQDGWRDNLGATTPGPANAG